jgi:putative addiction module killer protein
MKIDVGQGYRVYIKPKGRVLVILLCGGNKRNQSTDIKRAKALAKQLGV